MHGAKIRLIMRKLCRKRAENARTAPHKTKLNGAYILYTRIEFCFYLYEKFSSSLHHYHHRHSNFIYNFHTVENQNKDTKSIHIYFLYLQKKHNNT